MTALLSRLNQPCTLTRWVSAGPNVEIAAFTVFDSRGRCLGTPDIHEHAERIVSQLDIKIQNPHFSAIRRHKT